MRGFGGDPRLVINLTVWESINSMRASVSNDPEHVAILRRRREWFERLQFYVVLWWVSAGHKPSVAEAEERLTHLESHGPTPSAFTFRHYFDSPDGADWNLDDR